MKNYHCFNIEDLLDSKTNCYIGEELLKKIFSDFSCVGKNDDVEYFLKEKSIEFSRKHQAITYLVFDDDSTLVGYFSVIIKPLIVSPTDKVSKTVFKKIKRIGFDYDDGFATSAYLIAQLSKNFNVSKPNRISGQELLNIANSVIKKAQHDVGGTMEFIEYDASKTFLHTLYCDENNFTDFGQRETTNRAGDKITLNQALRII